MAAREIHATCRRS